SDLSISMAGYNTCMNVLTTGCRALVLPFAMPGNEEQTIRATKLEQLGLLQVIQPTELAPEALAEKIRASLAMEPPRHRLDTRGAGRSAGLVTALIDGGADRPATKARGNGVRADVLGPEVVQLRQRLVQREREERPIDVFLRNDDVGKEERGLRPLLNLAL